MNRAPMVVAALAIAFPSFVQAQRTCSASADQVLRGAGGVSQLAKSQPVSLDVSLPGDSEWVRQFCDCTTLSTSIPGAAAFNAHVDRKRLPGQSVSPGQTVLLQSIDEIIPHRIACKEFSLSLDASIQGDRSPGESLESGDIGQSLLRQRNRGQFRGVSGPDEEPTLEQPDDDVFHPWQYDIQFLSGYVGVNLGPKNFVPFSMVPELVRIGCIWNAPRPERFLSGCWEGIVELDTMPVVDGPATIVIGSSILIRYHCVKRKLGRIVPYLQYGGGGMYTNAYLFGSPVLSSGFEFILQAGLGVNIFLNNRWALTAEWNYYHFSNGGIVLPNVSVNMLGGVIGLTYYIGRK